MLYCNSFEFSMLDFYLDFLTSELEAALSSVAVRTFR